METDLINSTINQQNNINLLQTKQERQFTFGQKQKCILSETTKCNSYQRVFQQFTNNNQELRKLRTNSNILNQKFMNINNDNSYRKYKLSHQKQQKLSPQKSQNLQRKTVFDQIQLQQDCRIMRNGWSKTKIMLVSNKLAFFQCTFPIESINKIKLLPKMIQFSNVIKINKDNGKQIQMFYLGVQKKINGLPAPFFIFSRIIQIKLQLLNKNKQSKWVKEVDKQIQLTKDSYIYGRIFKKSQVFGNWQQKYVVIKKEGILVYQNQDQKKLSFGLDNDIYSGSIKYLWTRFDIKNDYLIIKIKHGIVKTQFAIPINCYSKKHINNWLYSFYRIMKQSF